MTTILESTTPRVWVGCLGCYNAGRLNGQWVDAVDADPVDMGLAQLGPDNGQYRGPFCKRCGADEFWCFDHENFRGLLTGECSPCTAQELAAKLDEIGDNDAFDAWLTTTSLSEYSGDVDALIAAFEDACIYRGESEQDAAYEFLEETCAFEGLPEFWDNYRWHLAGVWMRDNEDGGAIRFIHHGHDVWMLFL